VPLIFQVSYLIGEQTAFRSTGPGGVEITLLQRGENRFYLLNLLNLQEKMPPLPVMDFTVGVNLGQETPKAVMKLPEKTPLKYVIKDGFVEINIDKLDLHEMIALYY
jgi:hypothetical protein